MLFWLCILCDGSRLWSRFAQGLLRLRSRIVERHLHPNLSRILAPASKVLPYIALTTAGDDDIFEVDPGIANQIRPLVVGKDGNLELVVIRRVVHSKAELLIPNEFESQYTYRVVVAMHRAEAYHLGVCPPRTSVAVFLASLPNRAAQ